MWHFTDPTDDFNRDKHHNGSKIHLCMERIQSCKEKEKKKKKKKKRNIFEFGILLPKLSWPTVRKNYSSDGEKLLKFEVEGREFAKI